MISLKQLIEEHGALDHQRAARYVLNIADCLAAIHMTGRVFGGFGPSSIMLDGADRAAFSPLDMRIKGHDGQFDSPPWSEDDAQELADYLAPELALSGRAVDARADLYSLGCTWFLLLTGRPPFPGGSVSERLVKRQTAQPPSIADLRSDTPETLAQLCQRLLAKKPSERPSTASEVAGRLRRWSGA